MKPPVFLYSLLWGCWGLALSTHAQTAHLDTTRVYELEEVQFTPKRLNTEIAPFQSMDNRVLEQLNCQSVADAVRFFSGLQLKDYGGVGGLKTINIRSMGSSYLGVFYDGIQLDNAQNGQIDLGRFSLDNMESIRLYNGQRGGVLLSAKEYGSAGTLYLNSHKPTFEDGQTYHIRAGMKAGSFGLLNPSVVYEQKLGKQVALTASAEYTSADGVYPFTYRKVSPDGSTAYDTTALRENSDINAVRTEAGVYGQLPNGEWKAQVYNYYSDRGLPGYIARNLYQHSQRQWDDNFFTQATYTQQFFGRWKLLANAKYAYDYTRYLNPDTTLQYIDNRYRQQETYISLAQSVKIFSCWELGLSADYQWNYLNANLPDFTYPTRHTGMVALATALKFPHIKLQASGLGTFVHEINEVYTTSPNTYQVVTPNIMLAVRPMRQVPFDLRAFYKRAFRMPTFNELYYTVMGGQAMLEPEYSDQYNVGVSYQYNRGTQVFSDFGVQVDAYYNAVKNKIVAIPSSNPFRWTMKNYGQVRIMGIDVALDFGLNWCRYWTLDVRLAYTYQQAQDVTDPNSPYYQGQIPYIPWNSGSAVLNLGWRNLHLNYSFIYTGERYDSAANTPENYVPPWYTHDVSLSYTLTTAPTRTTFSVQVNNLLNQQYEVVRGYPMPGTNCKLGIKVEW